jgi:hypothetical protein
MTGPKYIPSVTGNCPGGLFGVVCIADGTNAATITVKNSAGVILLSIVTKQPLPMIGPVIGGDTNYTFTASGTGSGVLFFQAVD